MQLRLSCPEQRGLALTVDEGHVTAREIIERLQLRPLPVEGGYYRETWASSDRIAADQFGGRYGRAKVAGTAIYYLLTDEPGCFSHLHRLPTDEVYHFYLGDPVEQLLLHPDGRHEVVILGHDLAAGQRVQSAVPGGTWQGSRVRPGGRVALLGTTMAPGFDAGDYEEGARKALVAVYPEVARLIAALTRE